MTFETDSEARRPQNKGAWYGFGFQTRGQAETAFYGHSGGAPGMNAAFRIYFSSNVSIVVLSNRDGPFAETLAGHYAMRMPVK